MEAVDAALLSGETETALIKQISFFCEELRLAARDYDPSHINRYLVELAGCLCGGALAGVLSGGRKKKRSAARKK